MKIGKRLLRLVKAMLVLNGTIEYRIGRSKLIAIEYFRSIYLAFQHSTTKVKYFIT